MFNCLLLFSQVVNNKIGDSGVASLSTALKINSSLIELNLGVNQQLFVTFNHFLVFYLKNNISYYGLSSLARALEVNSSLLSLHLTQ